MKNPLLYFSWLDVCDGFLCYNGGNCTVDSFGQAECECPLGYEGVQCEISKYQDLLKVMRKNHTLKNILQCLEIWC